jgi:hypothetical protein
MAACAQSLGAGRTWTVPGAIPPPVGVEQGSAHSMVTKMGPAAELATGSLLAWTDATPNLKVLVEKAMVLITATLIPGGQ